MPYYRWRHYEDLVEYFPWLALYIEPIWDEIDDIGVKEEQASYSVLLTFDSNENSCLLIHHLKESGITYIDLDD